MCSGTGHCDSPLRSPDSSAANQFASAYYARQNRVVKCFGP